MYKLLREMVHYRNGIDETTGFDEKTVMSFEERYDSILEEAREEYEYIPPGTTLFIDKMAGYGRKK